MSLPHKPDEILYERYKIRRIIGRGGMGNVYLAEDLRLEGRLCALKEVEHDRSMPKKLLKQARTQFEREATILARLDHPNLPKVSDFFSDDERDYLVMDFVPGEDLRTLMIKSKQQGAFLPERQVLGWAGQLAAALTYLHNQKPTVLHRDIKPSNLKLTPNGLLKLVDFGLVKLLAHDEMTITVVQGRGTAIYTPLEQYGGDTGHTDMRSDIYSFGATLYHLLTNHPPVEARERFLIPESLPSLQSLNPNISSRTERAVLWAMSIHPDDRPPDVETFRQALLGTWTPEARFTTPLPSLTPHDLLARPTERALTLLAIALFLISLIATLNH
ncbi:MAG: serine/threonine-protein kinase [Chloroflexota bacterium]